MGNRIVLVGIKEFPMGIKITYHNATQMGEIAKPLSTKPKQAAAQAKPVERDASLQGAHVAQHGACRNGQANKTFLQPWSATCAAQCSGAHAVAIDVFWGGQAHLKPRDNGHVHPAGEDSAAWTKTARMHSVSR